MHAIRPISVCVFDVYGTLLDVGSAVAAQAASIGSGAHELSALWRRKQLEYTWLRSLMRRHADFWRVTGDALDFALEAMALPASELRPQLLAAYRRLAPYPDVVLALRALRSGGMQTAILSNGSRGMLEDAVRAAGIADLLDACLSVDEVGVFKPAPEVYRLAVDRFGVPPSAVAFLSSNGWDVHGAASFGFQSIWVDRTGLPDDRLPGAPVHVIADLASLPALLGLATMAGADGQL
jgi:2-haloacid dehalogenase